MPGAPQLRPPSRCANSLLARPCMVFIRLVSAADLACRAHTTQHQGSRQQQQLFQGGRLRLHTCYNITARLVSAGDWGCRHTGTDIQTYRQQGELKVRLLDVGTMYYIGSTCGAGSVGHHPQTNTSHPCDHALDTSLNHPANQVHSSITVTSTTTATVHTSLSHSYSQHTRCPCFVLTPVHSLIAALCQHT